LCLQMADAPCAGFGDAWGACTTCAASAAADDDRYLKG
jgi:hypothetical protein